MATRLFTFTVSYEDAMITSELVRSSAIMFTSPWAGLESSDWAWAGVRLLVVVARWELTSSLDPTGGGS